MKILLEWYGRKTDFTADTLLQHHGTITGNTAAECMQKLQELRNVHDLAKYTPIEITYIYD